MRSVALRGPVMTIQVEFAEDRLLRAVEGRVARVLEKSFLRVKEWGESELYTAR